MQIPGQFLTAPLVHRLAAQGLGIYQREYPPYMAGSSSAADRRTLVIPPMRVDIGGIGHFLPDEAELDLNDADSWDTATPTDYATATNRSGVDFFAYVCRPTAGRVPVVLISASSTAPSGYTTSNSRRIGGFHCLPGNCVNLPSGHPYKDFVAGDILFNSIWDLIDCPRTVLKRGMAKISLTPWDGQPAIWVDIYLASGTGTTCTSVFGATIKDTVDWNTFVEYGRLQGKRLLRDHEFQQAAVGSNEETNITGSTDPGTVTFPLDTAGRSMISNYGIIGMCGIMWQWLDEQSYRFDAAANHTHQVVVSGEAQTVTTGNPSGDVAPAWGWYNLPGTVGSIYRHGTYGDVKLRAGGAWNDATHAGSRTRFADSYRWYAASNVGGRFVAEPQ